MRKCVLMLGSLAATSLLCSMSMGDSDELVGGGSEPGDVEPTESEDAGEPVPTPVPAETDSDGDEPDESDDAGDEEE